MAPRRIKRGDGRFSVNMTVAQPDGTKSRVYFYGRTQAEAKRKAQEARERLEQGMPIRDATRTVGDWLAEWRGTFLEASDRAPSTKQLCAGLTLRHVEPVIGRTPLGQVRPSNVTQVLLSMDRAGKAASTRRNTYAAMRPAFDDAVADGLLAANPVLRVRRPKASSAEALSLSVEEAKAFLAGAEGLRYAGVLRLILGTGLRKGRGAGAALVRRQPRPRGGERQRFTGAPRRPPGRRGHQVDPVASDDLAQPGDGAVPVGAPRPAGG